MKIFLIAISLLLVSSCKSQKQSNITQMLENSLEKESYSSLFLSSDYAKVDSLWDNFEKKSFEALISNTGAGNNARLLASEILFLKDKDYPRKELYTLLSRIYVEAIYRSGSSVEEGFIAANAWGIPGEMTHYGYLGERLLLLGDSTLTFLIELLDNEEDAFYEGSEEVVISSLYHFRVKDIAAFYIANIKKVEINLNPDVKVRDKEIERLKSIIQ